ncbi:MAG TPA: DUF4404 family protein [Caldimonas sp.]|nr:DUF4404 family protein [Caldimonas sp.]
MADSDPLGDSLQRLRAEIRALPIDDEASRQRLEALVQDISRRLETRGRPGADASLGARLNAAILGLEASHPRIAGLLNELMQELGNMGI